MGTTQDKSQDVNEIRCQTRIQVYHGAIVKGSQIVSYHTTRFDQGNNQRNKAIVRFNLDNLEMCTIRLILVSFAETRRI